MVERTLWQEEWWGFSYKRLQNVGPPRHLLGLDGANPVELPIEERLRLAGILVRNNAISREELESLGMKVKKTE